MENLHTDIDCTNNVYRDTRGGETSPVPFTQAVINGLAPGGGLYVPENIPHFSLTEICKLAEYPYRDRASAIYKAFGVDLSEDVVSECMRLSYGDNFDNEAICPITTLPNETHMLELWHGPTSAFKDMALQCLPNFFSASAKKLRAEGNIDHDFCILVATSGDTGKAALEGFKGISGVSIGVLFPNGGVSDIQRKQMVTTTGNNVHVWAVRGNFDDCQTAVKKVFSDAAFASELMAHNKIALSSANSINWGRLLPQIVYYISAYAELVAQNKVSAGHPLDVCVPTGNFGNILAAWYAKQMGTPIETLFCASNDNRVLTDFINTGDYDISDREFVLTPSPSMDILVSSNLERQLFELTGRNPHAIKAWMSDLASKRAFSVDEATLKALQATFKGYSVDSKTCLRTIKEVLDAYNYLIDPHTAVAYHAAQQLRQDNPVLVACTAHWAKFGDNVYRALHDIAPGEPLPNEITSLTGCQLNHLIAEETNMHNIPAGLADIDDLPARFTDVIDDTIEAVEAAVTTFLNEQRA